MKLTIDDEFKALIPALSQEEYSELEQNLIDNGCRDAIVVWRTKGKPESKGNITVDTFVDTIIDGHNRYELCQKHSISFTTYPMWFDTRDDVRLWIIKNQFARRNIDKIQRSRLALAMKGIIAAKAKENLVESGKKYGKGSQNSVNPIEKIDTQKELAAIADVSHDTIHKVETVDTEAPKPIKQAMTNNLVSINKAYEATKNIQSLSEHKQQEVCKQIEATYDLPESEQKKAVSDILKSIEPKPEPRFTKLTDCPHEHEGCNKHWCGECAGYKLCCINCDDRCNAFCGWTKSLQPEHEEAIEKINTIYSELPQDGWIPAAAQIIMSLPEEQKESAKDAALEAFVKNDPESQRIKKENKIQQFYMGLITKSLAISDEPEDMEAWLSDLSIDDIKEQIEYIDSVIENYKGMQEYAEKELERRSKIRMVRD